MFEFAGGVMTTTRPRHRGSSGRHHEPLRVPLSPRPARSAAVSFSRSAIACRGAQRTSVQGFVGARPAAREPIALLAVRDRLAVTPIQYRRVAYVTLASLTLIVLTGAAVRRTDSGLGCENWPKCGGTPLPPLSSHALIEFGNRAVSGIVGLITVVAAVLAWTQAPVPPGPRRWLALLLPLGVLAQAVLGGFTVLNHLAPGFVMAHFSLSLVILVAAFALAWRSTYRARYTASIRGPGCVWSVRGLLPLGALTIFAGTAATAAGPHSGRVHGSGRPPPALRRCRHAGLDDSPACDDRRDLRRRGDRNRGDPDAARGHSNRRPRGRTEAGGLMLLAASLFAVRIFDRVEPSPSPARGGSAS